jgi:hypothetical protein
MVQFTTTVLKSIQKWVKSISYWLPLLILMIKLCEQSYMETVTRNNRCHSYALR